MKKPLKRQSKKKRKKPLNLFFGFLLILSGIILSILFLKEKEVSLNFKIDKYLKKRNINFEKIINEEKIKIYHIFVSPKFQKSITDDILQIFKKEIKEKKFIKEKEEDLKTISILSLKTDNENLILYFFSEKEKEVKKEVFKGKKNFAIVMDDLGYTMEPYSWFSQNKYPVTLSFLPGLPHTKDLSEKLHKLGYEILIHIPMEPVGFPDVNPGKDAIFTFMEKSEIEDKIENFVKEIPFAKGVNNHMGSAFTSNLNKMLEFMEILKKKNLFFLDSRTTPETKGCQAGKIAGVFCIERVVFLDNIPEEKYINSQFEMLLKKSKEKEYNVAICHPHPETFKILNKLLPKWSKKAKLVSLSELKN